MRSLPLSSVIEDDLFVFELVSWWQNNLVLHFSCCRARRHRCTFQEKRGGEKEKAPSVSLSQPVAPLASYDAAQLAKGEGLSTASGSRKVLGNANASAMAAAKARLITPSSQQRWQHLPGLPAAAGQPAAQASMGALRWRP